MMKVSTVNLPLDEDLKKRIIGDHKFIGLDEGDIWIFFKDCTNIRIYEAVQEPEEDGKKFLAGIFEQLSAMDEVRNGAAWMIVLEHNESAELTMDDMQIVHDFLAVCDAGTDKEFRWTLNVNNTISGLGVLLFVRE